LPGAGKSTIASSLVSALRSEGILVCTFEDFSTWMSRRSRFYKVSTLFRDWPWAAKQLWLALRFGLSQRPVVSFSLYRILMVPYVNCCFEAYIAQEKPIIVVMDQANMQRVWSVGAYASKYDSDLLYKFSRIARGKSRTIFAYISASCEVSLERIQQRPSMSSRFDHEPVAKLQQVLACARNLMGALTDCAKRDVDTLVELDAMVPVKSNTQRLMSAVCFDQNNCRINEKDLEC